MLMAAATDLLVIFLALEILSLAIYILSGFGGRSKEGAEAAFKYFLLGGFSSAFFLYGIAFTYGVAGTTRLDGRRRHVASERQQRRAELHCDGSAPRRVRVQGIGGAVPHVDA